MKFEFVLEVVVANEQATPAAIDRSLERVMEALVDMGVEDPFIGGSDAARQYELTIVLDAPSELDAFTQGRHIIEQAIK